MVFHYPDEFRPRSYVLSRKLVVLVVLLLQEEAIRTSPELGVILRAGGDWMGDRFFRCRNSIQDLDLLMGGSTDDSRPSAPGNRGFPIPTKYLTSQVFYSVLFVK